MRRRRRTTEGSLCLEGRLCLHRAPEGGRKATLLFQSQIAKPANQSMQATELQACGGEDGGHDSGEDGTGRFDW